MKRLLSVLCCLCLLLPFLVAPALAAEPVEYVFYESPDIAWFDNSSDFLPVDDANFYCDQFVPEGLYSFWLPIYEYDDGSLLWSYIGDVSVFYGVKNPNADLMMADCAFDGTISFDDPVFAGTEMEGVTGPCSVHFLLIASFSDPVETVGNCVLVFDGTENSVSAFRLVPVQSSASSGLTDVVSSEMISGVLDPVISVIPVVVGALAVFIGLRKGISWLSDVLHGS